MCPQVSRTLSSRRDALCKFLHTLYNTQHTELDTELLAVRNVRAGIEALLPSLEEDFAGQDITATLQRRGELISKCEALKAPPQVPSLSPIVARLDVHSETRDAARACGRIEITVRSFRVRRRGVHV